MTAPFPADVRGIDTTPALVIDEARMRANITAMAERYRKVGTNLRPHFKTSKMLDVARVQLACGAIGFTCATKAEVDVLLGDGVTDVLWAHQPVGADKVAAAIDFNRRGDVLVALDSVAVAEPLRAAARKHGVRVPFLIEIDTGLGRAGVSPADVVGVARAIESDHALEFRGVMTHEGHLATCGSDREALEAAGRSVGRTMVGAAAALHGAGLPCKVVSVGSTPGATSAPLVAGISEARPGTYVFYDANQTFLGSCTLEGCALTVVARVVSRPRPDTAIIDAGLKAMSSDRSAAGIGYGRVASHTDIAFRVAYEEHGVLEGAGVDRLNVGDLVRIVPNHACGTVNMWSTAHVCRGLDVVDHWSIVARR